MSKKTQHILKFTDTPPGLKALEDRVEPYILDIGSISTIYFPLCNNVGLKLRNTNQLIVTKFVTKKSVAKPTNFKRIKIKSLTYEIIE